MKKVVGAIGIFFGLLVVGAIAMILSLNNNMSEIKNIEINELSLQSVENGTYIGEYYYKDQIGATLEVTISNNQITDIVVLEHIYGMGGKAEYILDDIIEQQSIKVDDITGATTSSHVLKLAINNALEENK